MMFLAAEELRNLTGYQKPTLQIRWLAENGYSFDVRCDGRPVVSRAYYEGRHRLPNTVRPSAFDLAALDLLE